MTAKTNRRFVIGDVHGHFQALLGLLRAIAPTPEDEIYFLGDLIDRGEDSAKVVNFVMENNYQCILGNHEAMLLQSFTPKGLNHMSFQSWLQNGGYSTITSYNNKIPPEHLEWMRQLPLNIDLGDYWLVHAGLDPTKPPQKQNSDQFCWIRNEFHSIPEPYFKDKTIIIGHTITFTFPGVKPGQIVQGNGWIGIDTGAYHHSYGKLTALELNESMVYQVDSFGRHFSSKKLVDAVYKIDPQNLAFRKPKIFF
ncbi:serine/threonine protein phosphatase [Cyanobacterium stanieri LEGE 03274]|uniref:Serine/threonine protein phosphatase n=1 Tax=Cyanobacterium stanieri LEGE 03274 TaxID=1828756 RepID=A0ABR9V5V7_9CHRO|nr:metallophosphoesterase family protein [Cyanobacterium stanieri]MBE9223275.1 serine/threonine protein phosphatase [Cyanobacterium stanieri LEGE 03274]